jgi:chromate transporter
LTKNTEISEIAKLFLRLGFTAFGGPAAHIAMMQQEVVIRRNWFSEQHFLDLVGATNLIPGPNSTEMAMHIGRERAGWRGLIVAGICFIMPAVLITGAFAWLYKSYGQLPEVQPFIYGIKPAIIAVILAAIYPLGKKSIKNFFLLALGVLVLVLALLDVNEVLLLFGAGLVALLMTIVFNHGTKSFKTIIPFHFLQITSFDLLAVTNTHLFWVFLKIGAILYGSGYVLFAFLDTELVSAGILTRQQLVDAIAVGQFTPGPVFSSVTFIGYQINGSSGAIISTIAIFLPSFFFVALLNPLVKKMRDSTYFSTFLDAVNVASVAIIAAVCYFMGRETINDWRTMTIAVISLIIVFSFRHINTAWIVLGGALAGYLLSLV